ncbi:hypothetical protein CGZ91_10765 [Parenemella sanctibonifatiensis]|uniref:Amine oxidase domain-containing protein n=1 Tax=Parenemella sanctibonifatiensis TaxID=2016505 RepID=A0A255ECU7_9ACTN|nr:hypothetical protein CGZ91_10765 [Parenemella sanctibonifatiensis]
MRQPGPGPRAEPGPRRAAADRPRRPHPTGRLRPRGRRGVSTSGVRSVRVIGAGIAGLTVAYALQRRGIQVRVVEATDRVGGVIRSARLTGAGTDVRVDTGAEAYALRSPVVADLCAELGLSTESPAAPTSVWRSGAGPRNHSLVRMPAEAIMGIPADPLDPAVVAAIGEPAARDAAALDRRPVRDLPADVAGAVTARYGAALLDGLVRPMVTAIHRTAPEDLPLDRLSPGLYADTLALGSLAAAVSRHRARQPAALSTVTGGLWQLPEALSAAITDAGGEILLSTTGNLTEGGADAEVVVIATDASSAVQLLANVADSVASDAAALLAPATAVRHLSLLVTAPALDQQPFGSGALLVGHDGVAPTAITHLNAKWSGLQLPAGQHVVRLSYRGDRASHVTVDDALAALAELLGELGNEQLTLIDSDVTSWTGERPPLSPAASGRLGELAAPLAARGIHLAGRWVAGNGLLPVVSHALQLADRIADALSPTGPTTTFPTSPSPTETRTP